MASTRFRLNAPSAVLHWDGQALHGAAVGRTVRVAVPARLVSFRSEALPPADGPALKAAARLKAERAFSSLGAVAVEAVISPAEGGAASVLLLALPRSTIAAIDAAAKARGHAVGSIGVAELLVPVPTGGVAEAAGEACLIAFVNGHLRAVAALGRIEAAGFAAGLERERLRLGVPAEAAAMPAAGGGIDFLHPDLEAAPPLWSRRGFRVAVLVAGLAGVLALAAGMAVFDVLGERSAAQGEAAQLRPLAAALGTRRAELAEVRPWFDTRPSLVPGLHALAAALPPLGDEDQVRLVRVRQVPGEDAVVEATAADRGQMMAFLARLRRDPRIATAVIRSSRTPAKDSRAVTFELVFRLVGAGGSHAAS